MHTDVGCVCAAGGFLIMPTLVSDCRVNAEIRRKLRCKTQKRVERDTLLHDDLSGERLEACWERLDLSVNETQSSFCPAQPLNLNPLPFSPHLCRQFGAPSQIDFLSLDVEGAESLVMKNFPWSHGFQALRFCGFWFHCRAFTSNYCSYCLRFPLCSDCL